MKIIVRKAHFIGFIISAALTLFVLTACNNRLRKNNYYSYSMPQNLNDGIPTGNLTEAGIDPQKIKKLTQLILADSIPNIHSLLIEKDGKLVYENYFSGDDERWGKNLGYISHAANDLHDIRSISKSVVSACIGIAVEQHLIKSIDQPIFSFFPEYERYATGQKKNITIRHLLTMSSGLEWNEEDNGKSENCESHMEHSQNPVEYILSRPLANNPGTSWNYNSGGTQILAAIIKKVSGQNIDEFAAKNLFIPLSIQNHQWVKMDGGDPAAASGLRLTSRDLLKFANLYFNDGIYDNRQILPKNWIDSSFNASIKRSSDEDSGAYGYQFWIDNDSIKGKSLTYQVAKGNGGQRIFFFKDYQMIVIVTAGNYHKSLKNDSHALVVAYVIPAVEGER
jgi:CubicO group peptidase (beta-lactamase class C family)